ncbi:MAG: hypothetical protein R2824_09360 [Saprospiraceae bacterium]
MRNILDREDDEPTTPTPKDSGFVIIMVAIALHALMYVHGTRQNFCGFHLPGMLVTLAPMLLGLLAYFLLIKILKKRKWVLVVLISVINLLLGLANYMVIC